MPFKCGKDNPAYGKPMSQALVENTMVNYKKIKMG